MNIKIIDFVNHYIYWLDNHFGMEFQFPCYQQNNASVFSKFSEPICLTSDPNYKKLSGSCFYFETSKKTHSDAKESCKTKFGPGSTGRLFEPRSSIMNQEVFNEATKISQINANDALWMGITNFRDNSVFEYESDGQAVISGLWDTDPQQPNDHNTHHCVLMDEG